MNANLMTKKIEMTKNEAKAAGKMGTPEFEMLMQHRAIHPTFEIIVKAAPKRRSEFKGLTYKYMIAYIQAHDKENTIIEEFNTLIAKEKKDKVEGFENLEAASYLDVKEWFLAKFPEIKQHRDDHRKKVQEILNKVA